MRFILLLHLHFKRREDALAGDHVVNTRSFSSVSAALGIAISTRGCCDELRALVDFLARATGA